MIFMHEPWLWSHEPNLVPIVRIMALLIRTVWGRLEVSLADYCCSWAVSSVVLAYMYICAPVV